MAANKIPVAIQLYSLRDVAPKDVPGTLRKVADMGYEGVEFAGYYGLAASELAKMMADCGLRCAGSHVGMNLLEGDAFEETVAMNKTVGNDRLIVPWSDLKDMQSIVANLNKVHARAKAAGMRVGFHNHKNEFEMENGISKFDFIFAGTPNDFLMQLDIGWAAAAGQDVPAILRKYARRIETVHVKEFSAENPKAAVGEGSVDWPSVFNVLEKETSVKWYVVEQEKFDIGPMESAKTCIENMRKMGR